MAKKKKPTINTSPKPARGLGQAVTRHRRKVISMIDKERENRHANDRTHARTALQAAQRHVHDQQISAQRSWRSSFLSTIASLQTSVLRSYGMTHPVRASVYRSGWGLVSYSPGMNPLRTAYTDFTQVVVAYNDHGIPLQGDTVEILDTIASMRGVFQHEFGHLLHTVPYPILWERALEEGFQPGDVSMRDTQWAWNALEDQRMESLCVASVPRLATYFTSMILNIVASNIDNNQDSWLLLAGRLYLPDEIRYYSRKLFNTRANADQWYDIVQSYKTATNAHDMLHQVFRAHKFVEDNAVTQPSSTSRHEVSPDGEGASPEQVQEQGQQLQNEEDTLDEFSPSDSSGNGEQDGEQGSEQSSPQSSDSDSGDGTGDSDSDSDSDGDDGSVGDAGTQEHTKNDTGSDDGDSTNNSNNTDTTTKLPSVSEDITETQHGQSDERGDGTIKHASQQGLKDAIDQTLQDTIQELRNDTDVIKASQSISENYANSNLPILDTSDMPMLSDENVSHANSLAMHVETSLSDYVTASAPHWVDRLDHGVINPLAFLTKDVGSFDYRRDRIGECVDGLNLHVSFLSDVSMSMSGPPMEALSVAMYAMALACQRLGIGSTYTLWSSDFETYRVWDTPTNVQPTLFGALGGTDPVSALEDLDTHNTEDAKDHLVFIFTDGEWGYMPALNDAYGKPGRRIVVVRYNSYNWLTSNDPVRGTEDTVYGSDALLDINNLDALPDALRMCIADLLKYRLQQI